MKIHFRRFVVLAAALTVAGCFAAAKKYGKDPPLAQYDGKISVPGLAGKVDVYRDRYGVPHFFAKNQRDLFLAVGYVHAQDRLWQMVFFRALAEGRMSEIFGDVGVPGVKAMGFPLSTFGIDKRQRIMGMNYMGEIGAALMREENPEAYALVQAYCDGVNAFIETHPDYEDLPVEFGVLRIKPEPWRVENMISFSRLIGSMLSSNLEAELGRHAVAEKFGVEKAWKLMPLYHAPGVTIVPKEILNNRLEKPRDLPPGGMPGPEELGEPAALSADAALTLLQTQLAFKNALKFSTGIGSNNWTVAGALTESGNAMLCNDPHLPHAEPALFYMMHLNCPGIDAYGVTFPGNPFIVLGHNRKLAWGATTSRADVMDLFVETVDPGRPGRYLYQGEWREFVVREEIIKVRVGGHTVKRRIEVRQSVHGPIINDIAGLPPDSPPMALRWTGWDLSRDPSDFQLAAGSRSSEEFMEKYRAAKHDSGPLSFMTALGTLLRGESLDDFIRAMDMMVLPNQNWIGADSGGRIAYLPGGLVPIRNKGIGAMPVPGESGQYDWIGFIPLMEIPHAIDPERGYVVTANNKVTDAEWYPHLFSTSSGAPWRAWRIEELIDELKPLSVEDMKRIQNDVYVKRAEWEVPIILKAVDDKKPDDPRVTRAADDLRAWDYEASLDSTAPVIFFQFLKEFEKNVLEDELPGLDYHLVLFEGYKDMALVLWMMDGESEFFDDKKTKNKVENMDDMIVRSLGDAMAWVEKKYGKDPKDREWGKVHWIKFYHFLGVGPLDKLSIGPFPHVGADQTVRNAATAGFGRAPYKALVGPTLRHIIDMGDPDRALMVIDGSQSGQWLSPHYDDMHKLWVDGGYVRATKDPDEIRQSAKYHLLLSPG
jgi:penicillin amidase